MERATIKSEKSTERVYVRFVNKTTRMTDVFWLDFDGAPVKYSTLEPNEYVDIDTFLRHPWIFKDHITKDQLAVNNEFHFFPPSWKELYLKTCRTVPKTIVPPPHRVIVMITLPIYSLRERSLQVLRDHCERPSDNPVVLTELERFLPKTVFEDLINRLLKKDGFYID